MIFCVPIPVRRTKPGLLRRLKRALGQAETMRLRPGPRTLVERVREWLDFKALTDEMPPIAPPDEEDEAEGPHDD